MPAAIDVFIRDGMVTLVALAILAAELVVLLVLRRRGRAVGDVVANALSGAFLILALRSALVGDGATAIAAFLGLAFIAHVAALIVRLRRSS